MTISGPSAADRTG